METPFETWLIGHIFEAQQIDNIKRERFTGLYFLASESQVNFANSLLERLILPDEIDLGYRLKIQSASDVFCREIIDELITEFERQTAMFDPKKKFIYHVNLP